MIENYKISKAIKNHQCSSCNSLISDKMKYLLYVNLFDEEKIYNKYCLKCSLNLPLTQNIKEKIEIELIYNKNIIYNEHILYQKIYRKLKLLENKHKLIFLRVTVGQFKTLQNKIVTIGQKGFPDFVIFFKNNKTIFVEIKSNNGILSKEQLKIQQQINKLNYEYYLIKNIEEFANLINIFICNDFSLNH